MSTLGCDVSYSNISLYNSSVYPTNDFLSLYLIQMNLSASHASSLNLELIDFKFNTNSFERMFIYTTNFFRQSSF